jgi:hypothetical protein
MRVDLWCVRAKLTPGTECTEQDRLDIPWVSDTFEQDPESGLANIILGPFSSAMVFVFFLWHR